MEFVIITRALARIMLPRPLPPALPECHPPPSSGASSLPSAAACSAAAARSTSWARCPGSDNQLLDPRQHARTPQKRFSLQQPRVQQPMVSRLNSSEGRHTHGSAGAAAAAMRSHPAPAENALRPKPDRSDKQRQRQLRPGSEVSPAASRAVLQQNRKRWIR